MESQKEKIVSLKQELDTHLENLRGSCPTTLILHKTGDKVRFEQRAIREKKLLRYMMPNSQRKKNLVR